MSTVIDGSASVTINSGAVLGITSGTAVASTSGTSIDFTGIPSWVKRLTVVFSGVSTNGTSAYLAQIGSGSVVTTGYGSTMSLIVNATASTSNTSSGFLVNTAGNAAGIHSGTLVLSLISATTWVGTVVMAQTDSTRSMFGAGNSASLSGALDRLRLTTAGGTDTFDAGTVNIMYEG